jgi:hypothetical protein
VITKEQAIALGEAYGATLHYTGRRDCSRVVGPRGGITVNIVHVRTSGKCKTWKTRPTEFRLPVKYGMFESFAVDHTNVADFHLAEDCPIREQGE